jgi:catechol 2,3-dioxygenase-like lactoylglutathione lyase family enzyme
MIEKLSHVTIYVLDQEKAKEVYTEKLGFEVRMDFTMEDGFRWLTVGPKNQPDVEFVLFEVRNGGPLNDEAVAHLRALLEMNAMGPGIFNTTDCQATYEELKSKGIEFLSEPKKQPYGVEATFRDGCGNWFSLTQH